MTQKTTSSKIWAGLIILYLVWGMTYLAIRYLVEVVPPILSSGLRNFLAGAIIFFYAQVIKKNPFPDKKTWIQSGFHGFLMLTIGSACLTMAAKWIPSGYVSLFPTAVPIWIVLLQWLGGNKPNAGTIIGCILGIIGVGLLLNLDSLALQGYESYFIWGAILLIISTLGWSIGVMLSRNVNSTASIATISGVQMLVGGGISLIISGLYGEWATFELSQITSKAIYSFLFLLIIGSIVGFSVFNWLSRKASPTLISTHNYVNPLVALSLGYLFAGEHFNQQLLFSAVLIFAAVFLISKFSLKK
jgi:drug/metabolite transporter (DMT)-like permease